LAEDGFGQDCAIRAKHCGSGFIATALNAQNENIGFHDAPVSALRG
jgi:hypothetical protein